MSSLRRLRNHRADRAGRNLVPGASAQTGPRAPEAQLEDLGPGMFRFLTSLGCLQAGLLCPPCPLPQPHSRRPSKQTGQERRLRVVLHQQRDRHHRGRAGVLHPAQNRGAHRRALRFRCILSERKLAIGVAVRRVLHRVNREGRLQDLVHSVLHMGRHCNCG